MRSAAACTMLIGCSVIIVSTGASTDVTTTLDDEPMCRFTVVFSSQQACQNGSRCGSWSDGRSILVGFSENVTAWQPLAATRCTSSAINCGSHIGGSAWGIIRPGYSPHHS